MKGFWRVVSFGGLLESSRDLYWRFLELCALFSRFLESRLVKNDGLWASWFFHVWTWFDHVVVWRQHKKKFDTRLTTTHVVFPFPFFFSFFSCAIAVFTLSWRYVCPLANINQDNSSQTNHLLSDQCMPPVSLRGLAMIRRRLLINPPKQQGAAFGPHRSNGMHGETLVSCRAMCSSSGHNLDA